jgi:hypothetical protein
MASLALPGFLGGGVRETRTGAGWMTPAASSSRRMRFTTRCSQCAACAMRRSDRAASRISSAAALLPAPTLGDPRLPDGSSVPSRARWRCRAVIPARMPGAAGVASAQARHASRTGHQLRQTETDLSWHNTTLLPVDDIPGAVRQLRDQDGGDLVVMGSLTLARTLISHDLVDLYRLMIEPIRLGGGKLLFPDDGQAWPLELVSAATSKTGVQICTYRPGR